MVQMYQTQKILILRWASAEHVFPHGPYPKETSVSLSPRCQVSALKAIP